MVPFLSADTARVLTLINLSIGAGIVINLARLANEPRWFVAFGDVVSTGIGAAALLGIWQVFPFQFGTGPVDWALIVRVMLVVAPVGGAIGIVAGLVSIVRAMGVWRRYGHPRGLILRHLPHDYMVGTFAGTGTVHPTGDLPWR